MGAIPPACTPTSEGAEKEQHDVRDRGCRPLTRLEQASRLCRAQTEETRTEPACVRSPNRSSTSHPVTVFEIDCNRLADYLLDPPPQSQRSLQLMVTSHSLSSTQQNQRFPRSPKGRGASGETGWLLLRPRLGLLRLSCGNLARSSKRSALSAGFPRPWRCSESRGKLRS